jgi:hypothetical protein
VLSGVPIFLERSLDITVFSWKVSLSLRQAHLMEAGMNVREWPWAGIAGIALLVAVAMALGFFG